MLCQLMIQENKQINIHRRLMQQQQQQQGMMIKVNDSGTQFKRILKVVMLLSALYLVFVNISIPTLTIMLVILACGLLLLRIKLSEIKQKGADNFSPKLKQLLYEKSIFDIYSDIIYFPTISRIIAAFIKPIIAKPHPQELKYAFDNIHPKAKQIISTKGLINIFPQKVRAICQKEDEPLPPVLKQFTWYNAEKYKLHQQVHQDTLKRKIFDRVDQKVGWTTLSLMTLFVAAGIRMMNPKKAKKMLIQNSCFAGVLIVILIGLIKISRRNKSKNHTSCLSIEAKVVEQ